MSNNKLLKKKDRPPSTPKRKWSDARALGVVPARAARLAGIVKHRSPTMEDSVAAAYKKQGDSYDS